MKISVVLATYNGEKYIKKQLDSIIKQTMTPDEIIIIDDCSTDTTVDIIDQYIKNSRLSITFVRHTRNKGYKKTFLEAIYFSNGDYVFLADQDDVWKKNKIETMVGVMEENADIKVLNTGYKLIDADGKSITQNKRALRKSKFKRLEKYDIKQVINYNLSMGCTICFKSDVREILKQYDISNRGLYVPHDWIVNLIGSSIDGLYYLNEPLIYYRIHDKNTIGFNRANNLNDRIKDYKNMVKQKRDMMSLIKDICEDNVEDVTRHLKIMLESYEIRIECLMGKRIFRYLFKYFTKSMYKVISVKTMLYDFYLMLRKK